MHHIKLTILFVIIFESAFKIENSKDYSKHHPNLMRNTLHSNESNHEYSKVRKVMNSNTEDDRVIINNKY